MGLDLLIRRLFVLFFFFFQAEDGIRDLTVTGVQTCALPISHSPCVALARIPACRWRNSTSTRSTSSKRSEEHTSELQSQSNLVCRLLLEKKNEKLANTTDPAPTSVPATCQQTPTP